VIVGPAATAFEAQLQVANGDCPWMGRPEGTPGTVNEIAVSPRKVRF